MELCMVYMPVIPTLGRLKHGDFKFKFRFGYIARPCLKKTSTKQNKIKRKEGKKEGRK
jgi:hypothetical protein